MNARDPRWGRRAVLGLLWVAAFSLLYTAGEAVGLWPEMPPGAFHDLDLFVGAAGVGALCLWLVLKRERRGSSVESPDGVPAPEATDSPLPTSDRP